MKFIIKVLKSVFISIFL